MVPNRVFILFRNIHREDMGRAGRIALGTVLVLSVAAGVGLLIQFDSGTSSMWSEPEISSVVVNSEEIEAIEKKYTSQEERAWCLFGEVHENEDEGTVKVAVEEVVWDSDAESTRTSVEFNCQQGISAPEDADYIGHAHSHPPDSPAQPSTRDEVTGHAGAAVMGIYNGDELNFFAGENIADGLDGGASVEEVDYELN